MELVGRREECRRLSAVLADATAGRSGVIVLSGAAGIGKTVLLDKVARKAAGCRLVRIVGVEFEMELAYSGPHQLCTSVTGGLESIPVPQRDALLTALGRQQGQPPDRFLVGLAVLSLMAETSRERPLVLTVDDEQWLDDASRRALAFVARRLVAEPVGMFIATRTVGAHLHGLPQINVGPLTDNESSSLLAGCLDGPLDPRVRNRIVAEARGNPLALLEVSRHLTAAELAGGFGSPAAPQSHNLEGTFRTQIEALPAPTRRLLALAAAEPAGDSALVWRAAELLGIPPEAAHAGTDAGLIEIGHRVLFRHPLIRSTSYRCVPLSERRTIHSALAEVTNADTDPDRYTWHLGHAALGPDDAVADQLERRARRVLSRGGVAAAAAFLERASALTADPFRRAGRVIAAAAACAESGSIDAARELLKIADDVVDDERQRAEADLVRAHLAYVSNHGRDAAPLLLAAAQRLEGVDAGAARETYLDALSAALFAGRLAGRTGMLEVSRAARVTTATLTSPGPADLLLHGLATQYSATFEEGLPALRQALRRYGREMATEKEIRWMLLACLAAARLWDIERHTSLSVRYLDLVRATGAVSHLPLALSARFVPLLFTGAFGDAAQATHEMSALIEAMNQNLSPYCAIVLAAWRGRTAEFAELSDTARRDAERRGEGHGVTVISWAGAVLANGRCDYATALRCALDAACHPGDGGASWWALPEIIEAASRLGETTTAAAALDRLAAMTVPSGTHWGIGIEARSRALLSDDRFAEEHYMSALRHLGAADLRPDLARAHLLYGEWLRRQRRRLDARAQLRTALDLFEAIGMQGFTDRARAELTATGERVRPRRSAAASAAMLTAQEARVAAMAREGLSNPEIGERLFISARTVQYHLSKVFTKLGIRSRSQLESALSDPDAI